MYKEELKSVHQLHCRGMFFRMPSGNNYQEMWLPAFRIHRYDVTKTRNSKSLSNTRKPSHYSWKRRWKNRERKKEKRMVKNTETLRQQQQKKNYNSSLPQYHSYLYQSVICRVYNTRKLSFFLWPWLTNMSKINWIPLLARQFNFFVTFVFCFVFLN